MAVDFYQINDLERLSGVKAHTIRIWEKRYELITPHRTDTNIRYYDDKQLVKLLNVATLSSVGFRISKIAAMSDDELKTQLSESQQKEKGDLKFEFYINDFIAAMIEFDEEAFNSLFDKIIAEYGVEKALIFVVYPFLHKIGILWRIDQSMPVQEHFASMLIKRKLYSLISQLPKPTKSKRFLLFLPANEWHEVGLLFAEYIIRNNGFPTINLGQNVPFIDIEYTINKTEPDYLLAFLINNTNEEYVLKIQHLLSSKFKKINCLIAGNSLKFKLFEGLKNIKLLYSPNDILQVF
jgi:MerR family transcriptional regulator, light-induced transcriptional regulator